MGYSNISTPDDSSAWLDLSGMGMRQIQAGSTPSDQIDLVAEIPITQISQLLGHQKMMLESINGSNLSLLQQHALSQQLDNHLKGLQTILMNHPQLRDIDPSLIQDYIAHQMTELKLSLELPQSLPSLPSKGLKEAGSALSTKQEFIQTKAPMLEGHSVSVIPPSQSQNTSNSMNNIFNNMLNQGGLPSGSSTPSPPIQKYNYDWLNLTDEFFAAYKSGDMNKAMVIYQELSNAINQSSGNQQPGQNQASPTNDMGDLGGAT